jgi:hypothetical protein
MVIERTSEPPQGVVFMVLAHSNGVARRVNPLLSPPKAVPLDPFGDVIIAQYLHCWPSRTAENVQIL